MGLPLNRLTVYLSVELVKETSEVTGGGQQSQLKGQDGLDPGGKSLSNFERGIGLLPGTLCRNDPELSRKSLIFSLIGSVSKSRHQENHFRHIFMKKVHNSGNEKVLVQVGKLWFIWKLSF